MAKKQRSSSKRKAGEVVRFYSLSEITKHFKMASTEVDVVVSERDEIGQEMAKRVIQDAIREVRLRA